MAWPSPYLRMRVLGSVEHAPGKTIRDKIKNVSQLTFTDDDGRPRTFTWRTISTWLYRYKHDGITGMNNRGRSDKGTTRKITPEELLEAINQVLPSFRTRKRFNKADIYRACIQRGLLSKHQIAWTTFYRFIRTYELLKDDPVDNKKRLAFAMQYANQLWQADTMYGPRVRDAGGNSQPTYLIAFIDDASRVLCHGEFFFKQNVGAMLTALKSALYKRGIPEQLYVDNGSIYCSREITMVCARLGCILRHAPLRDGAAKGKVERFFRTVRDTFLGRQLDLSSLQALNTRFCAWVEDEYNSVVHSSLGIKPIDRFGLDLQRIRFLPPDQFNDELFFAQDTRVVGKDNTFSFDSIRYETPADLRGRTVDIRFDRQRKDCVVVYYKNQRMGQARPVDLVANAMMRNKALGGNS